MNIFQQYAYPAPGSIVSTPAYLIFRHKGIVSARWRDGKPMIISNSARRGGVVEETWDEFAQGQPVMVEKTPTAREAWHVLARASNLIGSRYDLLRWNCESFVTHCYGLIPNSPQLAFVALCGIAVVVAYAASRK